MGMAARHATEGPADAFEGTSRSPTERNAVNMSGSAAKVSLLPAPNPCFTGSLLKAQASDRKLRIEKLCGIRRFDNCKF
jgi:hypothetical protein